MPHMADMLHELHSNENILVFSNMNVHSYHSPGHYSYPILTGPFCLIQLWVRTTWVLKKIIKGVPKVAWNNMFMVKNRGCKNGWKSTNFYASNGNCSHLQDSISFCLKLKILVTNELKFIWYFITQRLNILFQNTFFAWNWILNFFWKYFLFHFDAKKLFKKNFFGCLVIKH